MFPNRRLTFRKWLEAAVLKARPQGPLLDRNAAIRAGRRVGPFMTQLGHPLSVSNWRIGVKYQNGSRVRPLSLACLPDHSFNRSLR